MSVSLKESYDIAYDGSENAARMDLFIDTSADLTGLTHFDSIKLLQGSTAEDISTGDKYMMQSGGTWVLQPSSMITGNYYTKAETDGRLSAHICTCDTGGNVADKVATTSDDFVLREGAIIAVKFTNNNTQTDSSSHPITINVNDTGKYRIYYNTGAYTGTSSNRVFGIANLYTYYVFSGDRWVWIGYSAEFPMSQASASAGTASTSYLISPKVLHDTILEQTTPLKSSLTNTIDNGAKNRAETANASSTTWVNIPCVVQPGTYVVSFGNVTSDDTDSTTCQVLAVDSNGVVSDSKQIERNNDVSVVLTVTSETTHVRIYASDTYAHSSGDTVTVSDCMVCTESDYAISPAYVPYCPTLAELYALVKSYHP